MLSQSQNNVYIGNPPLTPVLMLITVLRSMENTSGHLGSAVWAVTPPDLLPLRTYTSVAGQSERQRRP